MSPFERTLKTIDAQAALIAELEAENARLREHVRFLLQFVPPWAEDVPDELDAMFYGTLTASKDRAIQAKVDAAHAALQEGSDD